MSRGYARLRQWLILLLRMLAVAGLDFGRGPALGQRLGSDWRQGGRADTTIILLDRSPSMQQREAGGGRLETGGGSPATGRHPHYAMGSITLGVDRQHDQPASRELQSPSAVAGPLLRGTDGRRGRPARHARSRAGIHSCKPDRAHGDLDLLGPSGKRLARRQRPLANAPRELSGTAAGRPFPSAGVSPAGGAATRRCA